MAGMPYDKRGDRNFLFLYFSYFVYRVESVPIHLCAQVDPVSEGADHSHPGESEMKSCQPTTPAHLNSPYK
jgi:hypothetical protein